MAFKMLAYADNFEDVVLRRAFPDLHDGFYIDVGAYDPVDHSVTQHFYEGGWRGINVEPNPTPFAKIDAARDRDINLNIGLSSQEGQLTLYEAPGACWSVDQNLLLGYFGARPDQIVKRTIPVRTLAKVCEQHVPAGRSIEFLKVDVEGHEREVIEGGDWSRWRPRIVLCEANDLEGWEPILLSAGYHFALFDGVNRFYVREEDVAELRPRISVPANVTDGFLLYGYMKTIHELERSLAHFNRFKQAIYGSGGPGSFPDGDEEIHPMALRLARGLTRSARRHPRAAAIARKIVRKLYA
jgi:FkbM family methyltransferase